MSELPGGQDRRGNSGSEKGVRCKEQQIQNRPALDEDFVPKRGQRVRCVGADLQEIGAGPWALIVTVFVPPPAWIVSPPAM